MFDKVLKPKVTQTQVYDATAKNIVKGDIKQLKINLISNLFHYQMFCVAIMEPYLHMGRLLPEKRILWRV